MPIEDKTSKAIALQVLSGINSKLKQAVNVSASCAKLTLDNVISVQRKVPIGSHDDFIVTFDTFPGGAVFEASVRRLNGAFHLKGDVSRITSYGNQSSCVDDAELKLYCYCT
jgi:hypothetical protein